MPHDESGAQSFGAPDIDPPADNTITDLSAANAVVAELACLSQLEYGQRRKAAAKRIGIPLGMLDKEVAKKRPFMSRSQEPY